MVSGRVQGFHFNYIKFLTHCKDFVLGRMSNEYTDISVRLVGENTYKSIHGSIEESQRTPHALFAQPIVKKFGDSEIVGYLVGVVALESYLSNLLPRGVRGLTIVLKNTCGEEHTFRLDEGRVS